MAFQTILSAAELNKNLDNPDWAIMDCRFDFDEQVLSYGADWLATVAEQGLNSLQQRLKRGNHDV